MIDSHTADEIAKMAVEEILLYSAITPIVVNRLMFEELGSDVSDEDRDVVASTVRATLTNLAKNFSLA